MCIRVTVTDCSESLGASCASQLRLSVRRKITDAVQSGRVQFVRRDDRTFVKFGLHNSSARGEKQQHNRTLEISQHWICLLMLC